MDEDSSTTQFAAGQKWKLSGVSSRVVDVAFDDEERVYIVDMGSRAVEVYDSEGDHVTTIGGQGRRPGKLGMPLSIAIKKGEEALAVLDFRGRLSFFSSDGSFLHSFVLPKAAPGNTSLEFINDSLIAVGGTPTPDAGSRSLDQFWEENIGDMIHVFTTEGVKRYSFFPFSELARRMKTLRIRGVRFDQDASGRFYAVQRTEYAIGIFSQTGDSLDWLTVSPPYYQPLNKPEPSPATASPAGYKAWYKTWDSPTRIFSVNDTLLAVSVRKGSDLAEKNLFRYNVDFIGKDDGRVYRTVRINERLLAVNAQKQLLYFFSPPTEKDSSATLRAYHLHTFLEKEGSQSASPVAAR